jgi:uncharacterized protein
MEIFTLILIIIIGTFAGFINVIVGSGSSICVPFLTFIGLSPVMSIGTNRFAMLFNNGFGGIKYYQKKYLNVKLAITLSIFASIGSIFGAYWVLKIKQDSLNKLIAFFLIIETFVIIFNHSKIGIIKSLNQSTFKHYIIACFICLIIGIYGGFIGMAITSIIMFLVIVIFKVRFIESAAISKVISFSISFFASIIFLSNLKVDFIIAPILIFTYLIGAYLGVHSAIKMGDLKVKILFILVAVASAIKLFFF